MRCEPRRFSRKTAVLKFIFSYAAPLGMLLFLSLAALSIYATRAITASTSFPRSPGEFMPAAKISRRLADLKELGGANPADMRLLAESGRLKYQLGPEFYVEAIADLERARALGLAEVESFYYLGSMYQAVGLYEFSAQEYRKFLNNKPEDTEVRMLLAKLCYSSGDFQCAVREYEALLAKRGNDAVILENLALASWQNKQDYAGYFTRLRELGVQGEFLADFAEGRINYELKNYGAAALFLKKAADAAGAAGDFSDRAGLFWLAGDAAYRNKESELAYGYLLELVKLNPAHAEGKLLLAKLEKARKAAEKKKAQESGKKGVKAK